MELVPVEDDASAWTITSKFSAGESPGSSHVRVRCNTVVYELPRTGGCSFTFGRGNFVEPHPLDVSSQHMRLSWASEAPGAITVTCLGRNALTIRRAASAPTRVHMGESASLEQGEVVCLVGNRYPFRLAMRALRSAGDGEAVHAARKRPRPADGAVSAAGGLMDVATPVVEPRLRWNADMPCLCVPLLGVGRGWGYSAPVAWDCFVDALAGSMEAVPSLRVRVCVLVHPDEAAVALSVGGAEASVRAVTQHVSSRWFSDARLRVSTDEDTIVLQPTTEPSSGAVGEARVSVLLGRMYALTSDAATRAGLRTAGALVAEDAVHGRTASCTVAVQSNWRFIDDEWDVTTAKVLEGAGGRAIRSFAKRTWKAGEPSHAYVCPLTECAGRTPAATTHAVSYLMLCVVPTLISTRQGNLHASSPEAQREALTRTWKRVFAALPSPALKIAHAPGELSMLSTAVARPDGSNVAASTVVTPPTADAVPRSTPVLPAKDAHVTNESATCLSPPAVPAAAVHVDAAIGRATGGAAVGRDRLTQVFQAPRGWNEHNFAALASYADTPERYPDLILFESPRLVVVPDRFPKGLIHILVIPRRQDTTQRTLTGAVDTAFIKDVQELEPRHASLLREMQTVASELASVLVPHVCDRMHGAAHSARHHELRVRMGFHALPSLQPLHMHVFTDDLLSPCTRTPKHVRSFALPFLLPAADVLEALEDGTRVRVGTAAMQRELKEPMLCRCPVYPAPHVVASVAEWHAHARARLRLSDEDVRRVFQGRF